MWKENINFLENLNNKVTIYLFITIILIILSVYYIRYFFKHFQNIKVQIRKSFSVIENILELWDKFKYFRFFITFAICAIIIIVICLYSDGNLYIFGTLVASLLFVKLINILCEVFYCFFEDDIKINNMKKQYDINYSLKLMIGNNQVEFLYDPLLIISKDNDKYNFVINHKQKYFKLSPLIVYNYTKLLYAHRNDYIKNFDCLRLDSCIVDYNKYNVVLNTSKIKCFDHLVTNFALDYKLDNGMTLRKIYESGHKLSDLKNSHMANQIGINALVFLKDESLLMPKRGKNATISKNMVTSSIAMAYELKEDYCQLTSDSLFRDSILTGLKERLHLSSDIIAQTKIDIFFCGFGRVIEWGGKPQFYFCVWLDMDARQYIYNSININIKGDVIDKDKTILIVKNLEFYDHSNYLKLTCLDQKNLLLHNKQKEIAKAFQAETSFFCNCYHFKEYQINSYKNNWLKIKLS